MKFVNNNGLAWKHEASLAVSAFALTSRSNALSLLAVTEISYVYRIRSVCPIKYGIK